MPKDKEEDYDVPTLRKKIKRVDSLIKDEVPASPGHARLVRKRAKYIRQLSDLDVKWERNSVIEDVPMPPAPDRTESMMASLRENDDDDPTPAKNEKDQSYSYETLVKKISLVESLMKGEDDSFSDEFKRLEKKRDKYVKLMKETDKWKELHPNGDDSDDEEMKKKEETKPAPQKIFKWPGQDDSASDDDLSSKKSKDSELSDKKPAAGGQKIFKWPGMDDSASDDDLSSKKSKDSTKSSKSDKKDAGGGPKIFKWPGMDDNNSQDTMSQDHDSAEEEDDFDMGAMKSLKPGTVPDEIRLGGAGGYQLTDALDESSLTPEQIKCKEMLLKLMKLNGEKPGTRAELDEDFLITLCDKVKDLFLKDDMVLRLKAPIKICADIHGQFFDLLRIFDYGDYPSKSDYLFLGDYVDRGKQSVEVVAMLFGFKFLFPDKLHMLRGNHEISNINRIYGFHDECKNKYSVKLYKAIIKAFNCLPVVAVIDETVVCMHAGISPSLMDLNEVNKQERPCEIPEEGWLCDFVWSDPDPDIEGFCESDRGVSHLFGADALNAFLEKNDYELVVRGHQVVPDGYQFFNERKLVTLFSAPNYCGEFDNAGAIMIIKEDMTCSFQIFKPVSRRRQSLIREFSTQGGKFLTDDHKDSTSGGGTAAEEHSEQDKFSGSSIAKENSVDRKSYSRPSIDTGSSGFSEVFFSRNLTQVMKIEDLTRKNTSWGDIWEDLFYDDQQLADFKYEAFMESLEDEY